MRQVARIALTNVILLSLSMVAAEAQRRPDPNSPRMKAVRAVQSLLTVPDAELEETRSQLLADSLSPEERAELERRVDILREKLQDPEVLSLSPIGPTTVEITFGSKAGRCFVTAEGNDGEPFTLRRLEVRWPKSKASQNEAEASGSQVRPEGPSSVRR